MSHAEFLTSGQQTSCTPVEINNDGVLDELLFAAGLFSKSDKPMKRIDARLCVGETGAGLKFRYDKKGWFIQDIVEEAGHPGQPDMEVGDLVIAINGASIEGKSEEEQVEAFRENYSNGAILTVLREAPDEPDEKAPDNTNCDEKTDPTATPSRKIITVGTRVILTFEGEQFAGTVQEVNTTSPHPYHVAYEEDDVDAEWLQFAFQGGEWNFTNTEGDRGTADIIPMTVVEAPEEASPTSFMLTGQRRNKRQRRGKKLQKEARVMPYDQNTWYLTAGQVENEYKHCSVFIDRPLRTMKFEYRDHTADILLHSWGFDIAEAFEYNALAMFGYMLEKEDNLQLVRCDSKQTQTMEIESDDLLNLLFKYMDEMLSYMDGTLGEEVDGVWETKYVMIRDINITNLEAQKGAVAHADDWDGVHKISCTCWGEVFDRHYHSHGTDVKAITYSQMAIYGPGGFVVTNKCDEESAMLATHEDDGLYHVYLVIDI